MKKYPHIDRLANLIIDVRQRWDYKGKDENDNPIYEHTEPYPIVKFNGTVKLHGTNSAIVKHKDNTIQFQSKNNILSIQKDNCGFAMEMSNKNVEKLFEGIEFNEYCAIYGEWCGGNIQKGMAISQLPKMFVIFGVKIDDEWEDITIMNNEEGIYHISQFTQYSITIDFNNPEASIEELNRMTLEVENECPVGKYFGISGLGEGIVFKAIEFPTIMFKSKGDKHSVVKTKVMNPVNIEQLDSINEFLDSVLTENRLNQGMEYIKESKGDISQKYTGEFIKWIRDDIFREEENTIVNNQFDIKCLNSELSKRTKDWFFNNIIKWTS